MTLENNQVDEVDGIKSRHDPHDWRYVMLCYDGSY